MNYPLNEQEKESPEETHGFVTSTFFADHTKFVFCNSELEIIRQFSKAN